MSATAPPRHPRVALTFDMEHPSRSRHSHEAPSRILDALHQANARATFFVQGRWARSEPDTARRVIAEGHLLGSHSHFHAPLTALTNEGVARDVRSAADALTQVVGRDGRPWFRCPFGDGHDDDRVLAVLTECGYRNVHWNVEPRDWLEDCTAMGLAASVVDGVNGYGDGAIVLLHTWPTATAAALPHIIERLQHLGHELVGVDDLLAVSLHTERRKG